MFVSLCFRYFWLFWSFVPFKDCSIKFFAGKQIKRLTCIIFAGATFNLVQASRWIYAGSSLGTLLIVPASTLLRSHCNMPIIAFHPNRGPDFSILKAFVPPFLEANNAFTIFFNCKWDYHYLRKRVLFFSTIYR